MGLVSFVKSSGRKLGMFGGQGAAEAEEAAQQARRAVATAKAAAMAAVRDQAVAADITAAIASHGIEIRDLVVGFAADTATLRGVAREQADAEKAVLIAGNTEGVAAVDDSLEVEAPEPPAVYHTVVAGDSLSAISQAVYGSMRLYDGIFEANQPMLEHPDRIYPGQVLRVPRVDRLVHTVQQGETLGTIARHHYGSAKRYTDVFEANRHQLDDPNRIEVGQELLIPLSGPAAG